jgi:hypothetical protein
VYELRNEKRITVEEVARIERQLKRIRRVEQTNDKTGILSVQVNAGQAYARANLYEQSEVCVFSLRKSPAN